MSPREQGHGSDNFQKRRTPACSHTRMDTYSIYVYKDIYVNLDTCIRVYILTRMSTVLGSLAVTGGLRIARLREVKHARDLQLFPLMDMC